MEPAEIKPTEIAPAQVAPPEIDPRTRQDIDENPAEWLEVWGCSGGEAGARFEAF